MILLEGSRRSEGAFACTVSLIKALQYSNDLWKSRTAPVFETFKFKEGIWCSICYRDYKSEIIIIALTNCVHISTTIYK